MFTGIIELMGTVTDVQIKGSNRTFWVESSMSAELKVDQSLSHNGVCLTVEEVSGTKHRVTAIGETLSKTNLGSWAPGTKVNLERCLRLNDRLDGHFVQGHVDGTGTCIAKVEKDGSFEYEIEFPQDFAALVIEKGSVCLDGISLTAFRVMQNRLTVAIIPYTYQHTNFQYIKTGDVLNIEFDVLGKYIQRSLYLGKQ